MEWLSGLLGHLVGGLLGNLIELTLGILAPIIAGLLVALIRKQLQKINIQLSAEHEKQLEAIVMQAIRYVEELARKTPMPADDKLVMAERIVRNQRPDLDPIDITQRLHSALPQVRAEIAAGARPPLPTIDAGLPAGGRR